MSNVSSGNYALGRLILDYIKAFMWPAVALVVVIVYQDDVRRILTERQVDIFGLRIGDRVEQIETQALAEIEDIRVLLETRERAGGDAEQDARLNEDIDAKLSSLERNLSREISQVRETGQAARSLPSAERPAATGTADSRAELAEAAERRGFEALIKRDASAAITAFEEAYEVWPEYHNVAEISRVLRERREDLADPESEAWPTLYREILTRYSWGMPQDQRRALRSTVEQAY